MAILSCCVSIQLDRNTCSGRPTYTFSFSVMTSTTLCQLLVQWEGKHAAQPCCSAVCCKRYTSDNELATALCRHYDMVQLSFHSLYACPSSVSVMQLWYRANANTWGWSQETFYASVIEPQNAWLRMLTCWAWCMLARDWRLYLDSIIISRDTVVQRFTIALCQHVLLDVQSLSQCARWSELVNQPKQLCTVRAPCLTRYACDRVHTSITYMFSVLRYVLR